MAFPTKESVTTYSNACNLCTHPVTMPCTVTACDLLIMWFGLGDLAFGSSLTPPCGWTELLDLSVCQNFGQGRAGVFVKKASGCEGGGTACVVSSASDPSSAITVRITGWGGCLCCDVDIANANGGSNSPNPPSVTAGWGSCCNMFLAGGVANDDDQTVTATPCGYSCTTCVVTGGGNNNGGEVFIAFKCAAAACDDPGAFTLQSSESWRSITMVVKPGCAGGGGGCCAVLPERSYPRGSIRGVTRGSL